MFKTITIISIISYLSSKNYIKKRFDKVYWQRVAVSDWLTLVIIPILLYIVWVIATNDIINRPRMAILPVSDFFIIAIIVPCIGFSSTGNGIHFVSRNIFQNLKEHESLYHLNNIFHNLSHYPALIGGFLTFFLLSILEANHPLVVPIAKYQVTALGIFAIFMGYTIGFVIKYINADFPIYIKPLFFLVTILLIINYWLFLTLIDHISYYPVTLMIIVCYFTVMMILAFELVSSYLSRRQRTKWWHKIFGRLYQRSFLKEVDQWRDSNFRKKVID